jgi:hypothetical protein
VAPVDGTSEAAIGLQYIDDRFPLPQPYGTPELPPDLAAVENAWPDLPEAIKAGIVAMVKAAWPKR